MGHMKNFDIRIRSGGDDAIAAVGELTAHLEGEIERPRLTDAEREAVDRAADWMVQLAKDRGEIHSAGYFVDDAATLRGLLERLT